MKPTTPYTRLDRWHLVVLMPRNERINASEPICFLPCYRGLAQVHLYAETAAYTVAARPAHTHAYVIPCRFGRG